MSTYGPKHDALSAAVRSSGRCTRCQRLFHPSKLDAHHTIPRRVGGRDSYANYEALCDACHPVVERETANAVNSHTAAPKRKVLRRRRARTLPRYVGASPPPAPQGLVGNYLASSTRPPGERSIEDILADVRRGYGS